MSRKSRAFRRLIPILPACLALLGCAAGPQTTRPEGGGVAVRVPAAESFEFSRRREAPYPPRPAPFFEDDEYRYTGRWLTLFEMEFETGAPARAASPEQVP